MREGNTPPKRGDRELCPARILTRRYREIGQHLDGRIEVHFKGVAGGIVVANNLEETFVVKVLPGTTTLVGRIT